MPADPVPTDPADSTRLLYALIENATDVLLVLSAEGKVLFVNAAAEGRYGYVPAEIIGKDLADFVHPEDFVAAARELAHGMAHPGEPFLVRRMRVRTRSGEWRWVESRGMSRLNDPDVQAVVFHVRDITEQLAQDRVRAQVETAENEQRAYAEALSDAAALLSRAGDYEEVLDGILDSVARIVPFDTASIFLRRNNLLHLARARGFETYGLGDWVQSVTFPADAHEFRMLAERGAPVVISDVREYPGWIQAPQVTWIRSHLGAPIRIGGETVGMLGLDHPTAGFYTDEHAARLMAFADLAAAALHTAQLVQQARQRAEQLSLLYDSGLTLNRVLDARTQLEFLFKIARRALQADRMAFFRYDPKNEQLVFAVGVGLPRVAEQALRAEPLDVREPASLVGWVAHHRLPERLADAESDPRWLRVDGVVKSSVAVPVEHEKELRGVLIASSGRRDAFSAQDERLLILFANQVAAAMELTQLFQEQARRHFEMETLREASVAFSAISEREELLAAIATYALRLVHGDAAKLYLYESGRAVLGAVNGAEELTDRVKPFSPVEDDFIDRVLRSGERIVLSDLEMDAGSAGHGWHGTLVGQPLRSGARVLGMFAVEFATEHAFDASELRALDLLADQASVALEKVKHSESQRRRRRELEILREASLKFTATPDRAELIPLILDYALRLVAADNAILFLYENDQLTFGGILWSNGRFAKTPPWEPRENGITYTVARTGNAVVVDEVNTHPLFADWLWGGAIAGLPLRSGERVRAVLNVAYEQPHHFDADELRALGLLADQAAVALESARNYDETQRQLRDAQLLHRAGNALNHTLSFGDTAHQLVRFFIEAVDVEACCISTIDVARDEIRTILDHDPNPETQVEPGTVFRLSAFPHLQQLFVEKRAISFRRDAPNLPPVVAEDMDRYHWRAVLALPLFTADQIIGLVELADQHNCRDFTPNTVRLAESLAHQASSALQNARLYEETQRRAEELTLLNRIARGVSGARTLDELMDVIEREAIPLLPGESFYVALYDAVTDQVDVQRFVENGVRPAPFRRPLTPSLARHVIAKRRALCLSERAQSALPDLLPQFHNPAAIHQSWLGVPIRSGERVLGVIALRSAQPHAFGKAEEQLLQTIADQVGVAVERLHNTDSAC